MQEAMKDRLEELGRQYYEEVRRGHGESVETRSKRQIEIANEIVSGVTHYLSSLARKLLYDGGCGMSTPRGRIILSLRGKNLDIEDLVQTGAEGILRSLQSYRPDRGKMSAFLTRHAVSVMYKYGTCNCGSVYFPQEIAAHAMKVLGNSESRTEAVRKIARIIGNGANSNLDRDYVAITICGGISGGITSISAPIRKRSNGRVRTFEEVYLKDTDTPDPEQLTAEIELSKGIREAMRRLGPKRAKVIGGRFGIGEEEKTLEEIGNEKNVSRERIRQIQNKALKKLKKDPKLLKLFLEYNVGS